MKYSDLINQVAIRVNAVKGATETARIANMAADPLTSTQVGSAEFPFPVIQKNILSAVGRVVRTYAGVKSHPFRNYNLSQTASISSGSVIPSVNSANKPIVGVYGAIRSGSNIFTRQPIQIINSIKRSVTDGSRKGQVYYYEIIDGRLELTQAGAVIDVVTFDLTTETTNINAAGGLCPCPDATFDIIWTLALSTMMTDDSYAQQAQLYGQYAVNELESMKQGATSFNAAPEGKGGE